MSIYGNFVHGGEVEAAAMGTLKAWMPTYLAEMERQTGRAVGSLPQVRSWTTVNEFDRWPEDQLPAVILVSAGVAGGQPPEKDGQGVYRAVWDLAVAVIVSARDHASTRELAMLYGAAIRGCLVQRRSLGGFARGLDWVEERYDEIPAEKGRTLAAGIGGYLVEVGDVATAHGGPATPEPSPEPLVPPGDWPTVREGGTTVTVEKKES